MADTKREIERKYEADRRRPGLPDLTRRGRGRGRGPTAASSNSTPSTTTPPTSASPPTSLTLRRRTGGDDAGWHLKLPVAAGRPRRDPGPALRHPPRGLAALVRSRVRETGAASPSSGCAPPATSTTCSTPTARSSPRSASTTSGPSGSPAAAARPPGPRSRSNSPTTATPPSSTPSRSGCAGRACGRPRPPSKLARALAETAPGPGRPRKKQPRRDRAAPRPRTTAGDHVLAYVTRPERRDRRPRPRRPPRPARLRAPDAGRHPPAAQRLQVVPQGPRPHRHRPGRRRAEVAGRPSSAWTATRRCSTERLRGRLADLPGTLVLGPVRARLRIWSRARRAGSRHRPSAYSTGSATWPCWTPSTPSWPRRRCGPPRPTRPKVLAKAVLQGLRAARRPASSRALELPARPRARPRPARGPQGGQARPVRGGGGHARRSARPPRSSPAG